MILSPLPYAHDSVVNDSVSSPLPYDSSVAPASARSARKTDRVQRSGTTRAIFEPPEIRFEDGASPSSADAMAMGDLEMENEDQVWLADLAALVRQKFGYDYDSGDGWEHNITVEKILPADPKAKYPICLGGARACPPEDCGGYPGYADLLEALKARKPTEEQKERLEWFGGNYDPERFDLDAVNRRLAEHR